MSNSNRDFLYFSIYNLSRYIFLKLESDFEIYLEKFNITLPQLRVLWIVRCFSKITASNIAKIGCWSVPTVTNMLKLLEEKNLIVKQHSNNKKELNITLTLKGEEIISNSKINSDSNISLVKLLKFLSINELITLINFFREVSLNQEDLILEYVTNLNIYSLKFRFDSFEKTEHDKIIKLTYLYNFLRIFVLNVEKDHSLLIKNLNVTYPQLRALKLIKSFPGINSFELSKLGFWSHSTANLISNNLFRKGFIYKEKSNNKNSIELFITKLGDETIQFDIKNNLNRIRYIKILNRFDYSILNNIEFILKKIIKNLDIEQIYDVVNKTFLINSLN